MMVGALRFLVDECTGPWVATWLSNQGHEVTSIYDMARGISDLEIIHKANTEDRIIITNDKDFGELIFRDQHPHRGVILLRLNDERSANKIHCLKKILDEFSDRLRDHFLVATEETVRIVSQEK